MKVIFLIPGDQTTSGRDEVVTHKGRLLVATTSEETRRVPETWRGVDLDGVDEVTVTAWLDGRPWRDAEDDR